MPTSIWSPEVQTVFDLARMPGTRRVQVGDQSIEIPSPFPSPEDWRDRWIYFIMVDRFNNPGAPPRHLPWDSEYGDFQGGTFNGIRQQLDYLQKLGAGALWLSPVLKNCQYSPSYHGYGIQDFLAIEPRFASNPAQAQQDPQLAENELRQLIDEAHARGMYVIFDIVLHHVGDVFAYKDFGSQAPWSGQPYTVYWRDENGNSRPDWTDVPANPPANAAVWPQELHSNIFFQRQGNAFSPTGDLVGVDAALDFPLFDKLPSVAKGQLAPSEVANTYAHRKQVEHDILSTHGDASNFFVTFLDNHDQTRRFYYRDPGNPDAFDDQVSLGVGCLFTLPGIPCLYYGTEQGLSGAGNIDWAVRDALWGQPGAFDQNFAFYRAIQQLAVLRSEQPALRYGRYYFRP